MTERQTRQHELRCWPAFFEATAAGRKTYELRVDDGRGFRDGDLLLLREWSKEGGYTGQAMRMRIDHVFRANQVPGWEACEDNLVVLGVVPASMSHPGPFVLGDANDEPTVESQELGRLVTHRLAVMDALQSIGYEVPVEVMAECSPEQLAQAEAFADVELSEGPGESVSPPEWLAGYEVEVGGG